VDVIAWVVVALFVLCIPLIVIEARIMRKPEAERSERERRFLSRDRAVARGQQWYSGHVAPWLAVAFAVLGIVVLLPLWARRPALAAVLTACFVAGALGVMALWFFVLRKRGRAWREQQDRAQHDADVAGRPRFFISGKAGLWLGAGFLALGIADLVFLAVTGTTGTLTVLAILLVVVGGGFLGLGIWQFRAERRSP
jgi:hypothetical protein